MPAAQLREPAVGAAPLQAYGAVRSCVRERGSPVFYFLYRDEGRRFGEHRDGFTFTGLELELEAAGLTAARRGINDGASESSSSSPECLRRPCLVPSSRQDQVHAAEPLKEPFPGLLHGVGKPAVVRLRRAAVVKKPCAGGRVKKPCCLSDWPRRLGCSSVIPLVPWNIMLRLLVRGGEGAAAAAAAGAAGVGRLGTRVVRRRRRRAALEVDELGGDRHAGGAAES